LAEVHADSGWVGRPALDIERATGARVAFLTRLGEGLLPKADTVIQEGDLVHMVMLERDAAAVESQLGTKPEEL
jgi:trk system potassium uptake protein TrkA